MLDPQMKRGLLEACVLSALARGTPMAIRS